MIPKLIVPEQVFYRVHNPKWASLPLSGMGAANRAGRFNRKGQEALYLSADPDTALAEYNRDSAFLRPGTICSYQVEQINVADISAGFNTTQWDSLWVDHDCDWEHLWFNDGIEPPTWLMADDVLAAGLNGVLFPSRWRPGGTNLVIYDSSRLRPDQLSVVDPEGVLPRDHSSWRP